MSMLNNAQKQLEAAIPYANIDEEVLECLKSPQRSIVCNCPMRHDDGSLHTYKMYKTQYNNFLGPYKGGIRFSLNVDQDHIETLAFWMTFKCAALKIPMGGGKSGVKVDATKLSHRELERLSRLYVDCFHEDLGPDKDIPAPDMYTDERVMGWMYDEYRLIKGGHPKDFITGKPIALGGLAERTASTAYGGGFVLEKIVNDYWKLKPMQEITVAIQGFGKVGYWFAEWCNKNNIKVVAISNEFGGLYHKDGLNAEQLRLDFNIDKNWNKVQQKYPQSCLINNNDLLLLDVDVLVPAAIENVIDEKNAVNIKAKIILELANGPTTAAGDEILNKRGIWVLPDFVANGGGVVVSYYEWLQNRHAEEKTHQQIMDGLQFKMNDATNKMMTRHLDKGMSIRTAAYALALKRINDVSEALGTKEYFSNCSKND